MTMAGRNIVRRRLACLRRQRCGLLLAALCVFILMQPIFYGSAIGATLMTAGLFAILLLGLWALRVRRRPLAAVALLAVLTVAELAADPAGEHWLRPVALVTATIFIGAITIALLRHVLDPTPITSDKVFGAVAAYVLLALTFALVFAQLQFVQAHAFHVAIASDRGGRLDWSDLMYFSFTVLTSTGFGEITPISPMARSLIIIEQVVGVMYVAFLVARLANMYGNSQRRS